MDTRDVHTSTGTQQAGLVFSALDLLTPPDSFAGSSSFPPAAGRHLKPFKNHFLVYSVFNNQRNIF